MVVRVVFNLRGDHEKEIHFCANDRRGLIKEKCRKTRIRTVSFDSFVTILARDAYRITLNWQPTTRRGFIKWQFACLGSVAINELRPGQQCRQCEDHFWILAQGDRCKLTYYRDSLLLNHCLRSVCRVIIRQSIRTPDPTTSIQQV